MLLRSEEHGETIDAATLREQLRHVYWIGGGSCAGKSTIARRIADQHGLHLYATDDVMAEHSRRSKPGDCPLLHEFIAMDINDRWVNRSPTTMLDTFHWFRGEGFNMIIEDLLRIPTNRRVIVEGFRSKTSTVVANARSVKLPDGRQVTVTDEQQRGVFTVEPGLGWENIAIVRFHARMWYVPWRG